MDKTIPAELDGIVRTVVTEVNREVAILFGSRSRGDARHDSNIDLVVVALLRVGSKHLGRGGQAPMGCRPIRCGCRCLDPRS